MHGDHQQREPIDSRLALWAIVAVPISRDERVVCELSEP